MLQSLKRRMFLKQAALTGALVSAPGIVVRGQEKMYRTVLIGSGWWGMNILRCAIQSGQCQVVAMCDVDVNQLNPALDEVEKMTGTRPKPYKDYRELFENEKPEIAIVATPDHWHPLCCIDACKAGCHVYVEKPICHTIDEGKAMVKTARETDRVVQVGTHRRVSPHNVSGIEFLKSGRAGEIGMVRCFVHNAGGKGSPTPDEEPPAGLDWDLWCGPAPLRPFNPRMHPKGFRSFLDYANGTLGDWGIHWMDQVLMWTEEKYPRRVFSTGGRPIKEDNTDAPDTQVASFEFENFTCVWEHRQYAGNEAEKHNLGAYFYGTNGTFHMGWLDGWTFYPTGRNAEPIHQEPKLNKPDDQNIAELFADFLNAIKNNTRPVSDIEIGHRSTTMSLLGMLSLKLGRSVEWDGESQTIVGDPQANKLLRREYRAPYVYPEG